MSIYTKQDIMNMIEEEDVKFIRLQFSDIFGRMRNVAVTDSRIGEIIDNGCAFDGSAVEGFSRIEESDMILRPDLDTFTIFPWRPHQGKVARLICDIVDMSGAPYESDPRYILKKVIAEAKEMGYSFNVGPECEFFLFRLDDNGDPTTEPIDNAGYFDLAPIDAGENCRRDICLTLEDMGYQIVSSHHEVAGGQNEIDFKYAGALTTADRINTFKMVVKTIANRHGFHATFMPKPIENRHGSGMHLNMSLSDNSGRNIFYNPASPEKLSDTAYKFIAGLLKYTPDIACVVNPTVNSYKRFVPGFEAPCHIAWSETNRSLLIRVPCSPDEAGTRIEYRSPDPTANPYLALAACLKAGLAGIKEGLTPPHSVDMNIYDLTDRERRALGVENLPISLKAALAVAKESELLKELLGGELAQKYISAKEFEYNEYAHTVSKWETEIYLTRY